METSRIRRKGYLIDRKLQLELGLMVTTVALAMSSAIFATYAKYTFSLLTRVSESLNPAAIGAEAEGQARTAAVLGLSGILVLALVSIAFSLRRSHRIAGPLRRVESHIDLLLQGKFDARTRLRRNDELQAIVEKLNLLAEKLQKQTSAIPSGDSEGKSEALSVNKAK